MTLVLSMNPFCDHEAEPPRPIYQPIWEPEHSGPTHSSSEGAAHDEPVCRGTAGHVTMSRLAYFKRKYVEDDDLPLNFRGYRHAVSPVFEEHSHVLHLSLDKMRFIDDPEAFLRRSVLINNLLRRLRAEIILQGAWPFVSSSAPVTLTMPVSAQQERSRKRLRSVHEEEEEEEDECVSACCCFYEASRYMQLPVCVYETNVQPSSSSSSSAITERLECLFEEEEEEEEEEEVESDGEEELDSLCPGLDLCEASLKAREKLGESEGEAEVAVETGQQATPVLGGNGKAEDLRGTL